MPPSSKLGVKASQYCYDVYQSIFPSLSREKWETVWSTLLIEEQMEVLSLLVVRNRSLGTRAAYRCLVMVLNSLSVSLKRQLVGMLKKVRNNEVLPVDIDSLFSFEDYPTFKLAQMFDERVATNGKVVLSYDIDLISCVEYLPRGLELLKRYCLPVVLNFLTGGDYLVPEALIQQAAAEGHLVGLHGHRHDPDFGNRSGRYIGDKLKTSLSILGERVTFFRSPALSVSPQLINQLSRFNFQFDSTIPVAHPFHSSCGLPYCYKIPGSSILEFPVLLQDNVFFSDFRFSDEEAFAVSQRVIDRCISCGGVAMLNLHFCIERKHEVYHSMLLEYLSKNNLCSIEIFAKNNC